MTDCECKLAGWCNRHQRTKTDHLLHLCQTRDDYFNLWESGNNKTTKGRVKSDKQEKDARLVSWLKVFAEPTDRGIGDTVERLLAKAGGRAIKSVLSKIGVGCGCTDRQEWLNRKYPLDLPFRDVKTDTPKPSKPRLIITVGAGQHFEAMLKISQRSVEAYANRVSADFVQLRGVTQSWWGLEKFRVHKFAKQYEQTLFIDADILISKASPDIFAIQGVALHDDYPHLKSTQWILPQYDLVCKSQDVHPSQRNNRLLNSGVVLTDSNSSDVWLPPAKPLPHTHCAEQFWVEMQSESFPVTLLDRRFNFQWWMEAFQFGKFDAWFIHYANSSNKIAEMEQDVCQLGWSQ